MAARAALGALPPPPPDTVTDVLPGLNRVGPWFISGGFLIVIGVAVHQLGTVFGIKEFWKAHYWLMGTAVILLWVGVARARDGLVERHNSGHYWVGYIAIYWLTIQAAFGIVLAARPDLKKSESLGLRLGLWHRLSGILVLGALVYMYYSVGAEELPFSQMKHHAKYGAASWAVFVLLILVLLVAVYYVWKELKQVKTKGTNSNLVESNM